MPEETIQSEGKSLPKQTCDRFANEARKLADAYKSGDLNIDTCWIEFHQYIGIAGFLIRKQYENHLIAENLVEANIRKIYASLEGDRAGQVHECLRDLPSPISNDVNAWFIAYSCYMESLSILDAKPQHEGKDDYEDLNVDDSDDDHGDDHGDDSDDEHGDDHADDHGDDHGDDDRLASSKVTATASSKPPIPFNSEPTITLSRSSSDDSQGLVTKSKTGVNRWGIAPQPVFMSGGIGQSTTEDHAAMDEEVDEQDDDEYPVEEYVIEAILAFEVGQKENANSDKDWTHADKKADFQQLLALGVEDNDDSSDDLRDKAKNLVCASVIAEMFSLQLEMAELQEALAQASPELNGFYDKLYSRYSKMSTKVDEDDMQAAPSQPRPSGDSKVFEIRLFYQNKANNIQWTTGPLFPLAMPNEQSTKHYHGPYPRFVNLETEHGIHPRHYGKNWRTGNVKLKITGGAQCPMFDLQLSIEDRDGGELDPEPKAKARLYFPLGPTSEGHPSAISDLKVQLGDNMNMTDGEITSRQGHLVISFTTPGGQGVNLNYMDETYDANTQAIVAHLASFQHTIMNPDFASDNKRRFTVRVQFGDTSSDLLKEWLTYLKMFQASVPVLWPAYRHRNNKANIQWGQMYARQTVKDKWVTKVDDSLIQLFDKNGNLISDPLRCSTGESTENARSENTENTENNLEADAAPDAAPDAAKSAENAPSESTEDTLKADAPQTDATESTEEADAAKSAEDAPGDGTEDTLKADAPQTDATESTEEADAAKSAEDAPGESTEDAPGDGTEDTLKADAPQTDATESTEEADAAKSAEDAPGE
ncbi:MAG: hypothetical protein Q9192_006590, partial [Flavoplaca navasiana]